jgi:hypothetical protein
MEGYLLINPGAYLLINAAGGRLIIGPRPTPPPPPVPSSSGIGGGGRGRSDPFRRSRDEFIRQPQQSPLVIRDDDEIMAVISRFLDKL